MAFALIHGTNGSSLTGADDGMADAIKAVPQFLGSGNPVIIVRNTFLDHADADAAQPVARRSKTAPADYATSCDDATCTAPKLVSKECDIDSTTCGESCGDETDSVNCGESCGDADFCQESIEPSFMNSRVSFWVFAHFMWETMEIVESAASEEASDNSVFHEENDDREWDVGFNSAFEMARADEFDEPHAIESDIARSHKLSVIDLGSEPPMRDLTFLPPTPSPSDANMVTDLELEATERAVWADLDYEECSAPVSTFLSPTPPPSHGELEKGLTMMPFDSDSGVCSVRWKLTAKEFNSNNTTKSSQEFEVFFNSGKSLKFKIGLHPGGNGSNVGSWKKWKGQGRASLKLTDELEEQAMIRFRFVLGRPRDSENLAMVHDFSNNSVKYTEYLNFSSAAEGPDVFVHLEFLPAELPVLQ